ncbi:MAG: ABC transporter permease [Bacteroides sp.]|nr:ABC transporter permease [Bacteroides sp.]
MGILDKTQMKQIWYERRINLWLWVELWLVSVVLWYVVDELYTTAYVYLEPKGFSIEDTYLLHIGTLPPNSHEYLSKSEDEEKAGTDLLRIVERLRLHPEVEAVSLSINSYHYNGSNSHTNVSIDTLSSGTLRRRATADFLKVFRYQGLQGETPEELISLLTEKNTFIAGDNLYQRDYGISLRSFVGRDFYFGGDTLNTRRLVAVAQPVRYSDFSPIYSSRYFFYVIDDSDIASLTESNVVYYELCLRTRSGTAPGFEDRLRQDFETHYRSGNLFIKGIESMETVRHRFQLDEMNELRNYLWGVGFLLVNIFLGLLGIFWFRTHHIRSALALRMSFGSTRMQIFSYLLKEGLLLLVLATLPAIVIDHVLAANEYNSWLNGHYLEAGRFAITVGVTFVLIALTIVAGIWYPARQAMAIQPAEALHEE